MSKDVYLKVKLVSDNLVELENGTLVRVSKDSVVDEVKNNNHDIHDIVMRIHRECENIQSVLGGNRSPIRAAKPAAHTNYLPATVAPPNEVVRASNRPPGPPPLPATQEPVEPDANSSLLAQLEEQNLKQTGIDLPFRVNDPDSKSYGQLTLDEAKDLGEVYTKVPKYRKLIVRKIGGLDRITQLRIKDVLPQELRNNVVAYILSNDGIQSNFVPPDLAAFVDSRPISETIGATTWDLGNDLARDQVAPNAEKTKEILDEWERKIPKGMTDTIYERDVDLSALNARAESILKSGEKK